MTPEPAVPDLTYLNRVEELAQGVVAAAVSEGWVEFGAPGMGSSTSLQRAVNALAAELRMRHYEGDGCVDH